jgi:hypothetical protein
MYRWGIVITAFYLFVLVVLVLPLGEYLADFGDVGLPQLLFDPEFLNDSGWAAWFVLGMLATAEALLLFLAVDTSRKRLRPRQHILLSVAVTTFATGLLSVAILLPVVAAGHLPMPFDSDSGSWIIPLAVWAVWAVIFFLYRERVSERLDRTVSWLLNGSVLQLLIAVPCHIIVRQRGECSAPIATSFGISTGIAVMLMAFGPSVVFLYQKRLRDYGRPERAEPIVHRWPVWRALGTLATGALALFVFLPFDNEWFLGFVLPAEETPAVTAAVDETAEQLGMTLQRGENGDFALQCRRDRVARVTVGPAIGDTGEVWNVWLRADQRELFDTLKTLADEHATDSWVTFDPPAYEQWRAKLLKGAYFGRTCLPR